MTTGDDPLVRISFRLFTLPTYENIGIDGALTLIPRCPPPEHAPKTTLDQMLCLDSLIQPGLLETDFKKLFVKCGCGLIMTKRCFNLHKCWRISQPAILDLTQPVIDPAVIDLTSVDDDV
jgi:hypothetical protein